jgi:ADP-ribose pyrophosphatase YjhB (NUDIX family)
MIERKNRPTKESWWFSGGRILFGELRKDATTRKLKEECVLNSER